jgi:hypothetical protein
LCDVPCKVYFVQCTKYSCTYLLSGFFPNIQVFSMFFPCGHNPRNNDMTYQNSCLFLNPTETTVIKALLLHFPSRNFKVLLFLPQNLANNTFVHSRIQHRNHCARITFVNGWARMTGCMYCIRGGPLGHSGCSRAARLARLAV